MINDISVTGGGDHEIELRFHPMITGHSYDFFRFSRFQNLKLAKSGCLPLPVTDERAEGFGAVTMTVSVIDCLGV